MNVKSVKRALGLAASAVGVTGLMMLVPAVANAATAHPAHSSSAVGGGTFGGGTWGGGYGGGGYGGGGDEGLIPALGDFLYG